MEIRVAYNPFVYARMCCGDHVQIGHDDSNNEQCPLCRTIGALQAAREYLESDVADGFRPAERLMNQIDQALGSVVTEDTQHV